MISNQKGTEILNILKGKEPFLKITASMWNLMATFKKVLEIGFEVETSNGVKREQFSLFESNIDFEIRFMVDQKIKGILI